MHGHAALVEDLVRSAKLLTRHGCRPARWILLILTLVLLPVTRAAAAVVVSADGETAPSPPQIVEVDVGEPVSFTASATGCPFGLFWTEQWDFGDGTVVDNDLVQWFGPCAGPRTTTHTFNDPGVLYVTYRYRDCDLFGRCQLVEDGRVRLRVRNRPGGGGLGAFSVAVSTSASTCAPTTVTVTALNNGGNTLTNYNGTIRLATGSGHGDWSALSAVNAVNNATADDGQASYTFAPGDNGSVELALSNAHADDAVVVVTDLAAGVSATAGPIAFRDNAFVVTATDTLATVPVVGRPHTLSVDAVRRDPVTGTCGLALDYAGNRSLKVWLTPDALHPPAAAVPMVAGNGVPAMPPTVDNLDLLFTGGSAIVQLDTVDVGRYSLHLRDDNRDFATGMDIEGSSPVLTVRPFALRLDFSPDPDAANAFAADADGSVFKRAGEAFATRVTAVQWQSADDGDDDGIADPGAELADNPATPSFGSEPVPETVVIEHNLVEPAGGANGSLDGGGAVTGFSAGSALASLAWSEVGIIALVARLSDDDYLASGVGLSGNIGNVGRFRPHHFTITANAPQLRHALDPWACGFTYWGQPFGFETDPALTITALNAVGGTTRNYDGAFWKLDGGLAGRSYQDGVNGVPVSVETSGGSALASGLGDFDGAAVLTVGGDELRYQKPLAPDVAFDSSVDLIIQPGDLTDTDGVCYDGNGDGTCDPYTLPAIGGTQQRFGRLTVTNGYGSELRSLTLPVRAEYWQSVAGAEAFVVNADDSCTGLSASPAAPPTWGQLALGDYRLRLDQGETAPSVTGILSGTSAITLTAPGNGNDGSVRVTVGTDPWLEYDWDGDGAPQDPSARATFGIYRGDDRLIYRREVFN